MVISSPSPMARRSPGADHELTRARRRAWPPRSASGAPQTSFARSGMKRIGSQPSAISAVSATFFSPSEAIQIGMLAAHRVGDDLERLAQSRALPLGQGQREVLSLVHERGLAAPHVAADLDDLAGAPERIRVGHPVEALDDLGARRAEAQSGSDHRRARRCPPRSWRSGSAFGCRSAGSPRRSRLARSGPPGSPSARGCRSRRPRRPRRGRGRPFPSRRPRARRF